MADNRLGNRVSRNALGSSPALNPYIQSLMGKATREYPFIAAHRPVVITGTGEGYAETWPVNEEGAPDTPRPAAIPIDRIGIEVRRPNDFTHHDLAGEMLHIDPRANETRDYLIRTFRPEQWDALKNQSRDYEMSINEGMREEDARRNAIDSALRGFAVRQWPEEANAGLMYSPDQMQRLEALRNYMTTGK